MHKDIDVETALINLQLDRNIKGLLKKTALLAQQLAMELDGAGGGRYATRPARRP